MTSRTFLKAALVALVLVLTAGAATAFAMNKEVTITVDDEPRTVRTFSSSVSGALADAGLSAGERDALAPTADASISDGTRIELKRGRPLTVTMDGEQREEWVTELTVGAALRQIGIKPETVVLSEEHDTRIPLDGLDLEVTTAKPITLIDGGEPPREMSTLASTVSQMLAEEGLALEQQDTVLPAPDAQIVDRMVVEVTRVRTAEIVERREIEPPVEETEDPELAEGEEVVDFEGVPGEEEVTFLVTTVNGDETERDELDVVELTPAEPRKVTIGTKPENSAPSVGDGSVWDQLAECESGGNWSINTGNGYYGGLQFNKSTWNAYDGDQYAEFPHQASREEQIATAERLRDDRGGYGAWPSCSRQLGLS